MAMERGCGVDVVPWARPRANRGPNPTRRPMAHDESRPPHRWAALYDSMEATTGIEPVIGVLQTPALTTWPRRHGAEDEIRTRDPLLGKEMLYH